MVKKYTKKKDDKKNPNASGVKYRTPSKFIGSKFSKGTPKNRSFKAKANPGQFKTQHKG